MKHQPHSLLASRGLYLALGGSLAALVLWGASACSSTPPTRSELMLSGLDRLDAAVRSEVADADAEAATLAILAEFRSDELAFLEDIRSSKERLMQLNLDHAAARADFLHEVERLRQIRVAFRDDIVDTYSAIRETVEREEYLALVQHLRSEEARWKEMAR